MCGLVGFWSFNHQYAQDVHPALIEQMAAQIEARGPDSFGSWCEPNKGLAFGHRRLSIVELSDAGHQPMISNSGRMVLIYNGEIYNTKELRDELINSGCSFRGASDTEVILEACEAWGIEQTCKKLIGMFAFALWDKQTEKLYLVRDRLGIKPLYWGFINNVLFFGSQPKSFFVHPAWKSEMDPSALASYFRYNYVPAPYSIFKNIQKLKPAHILTIDHTKNTQISCFWNFNELVQKSQLQRKGGKDKRDESEIIEQLEFLLKDAVSRRMVADVPLGAFLSGGIDSSTVVALMQAQSHKPINTFSIGFSDPQYNEAIYARKVAEHLGTNHEELYLDTQEACAIIPSIPSWCDEPFADSSQIPTYLVSKLARNHVTIALSGDGGDEVFAGYNRYLLGHKLWKMGSLLPLWMRGCLSKGIRHISPRDWDKVLGVTPFGKKAQQFGDRLHKLSDILMAQTLEQFYQLSVSQWQQPNELVLGAREYPGSNAEFLEQLNGVFSSHVERMQYMDTLTYLPDDVLTKVDRASMAVSLEARVPLLDHRVVEFSWTLPLNMKIRDNKSKWILREILGRYVPNHLIERPKMGFGIRLDQWLTGPLRDWVETLISEERLRSEGILNAGLVRTRWKEHLSGRRNWQNTLWSVLMFQAWREHWKI